MFGVPIVLNPLMFVPFILTPVVSTLLTYFAMTFGWVAKTNGVSVPWTMPPIISGYLATSSVSGAVMQIVNIAVGVLIYYPFFKVLDNQARKGEELNG